MLNRRFLRQKSLQAIYAYIQTGDADLAVAEKNLRKSIHKLYDLYIYMLSFLVELTDFAYERMEEDKAKHFPTEEEKNPSTNFVRSQLIQDIRMHPVFQENVKRLKINWSKEKEMTRAIFQDIKRSKVYQDFLNEKEPNMVTEAAFWSSLWNKKISESPLFYSYFEEQSIYWADDYSNMTFWIMRALKSAAENPDALLLTEEQFVSKDDEAMAVSLMVKTINNNEDYEKLVAEKLQNWELERVALIDMIIMKMAVAELLNFPSIPVKATLNEYVEMTKSFSSENSRLFVNGILHKLVIELKESKKLKKTGRGLIEN